MYSRGVYPIVQPRLTALSNSTPFAWFDALVLLTIGVDVVLWTVRLRARGKAAVGTHARRSHARHGGDRRGPVPVVSRRVGTELSAPAASRAARFSRRAHHARRAARARRRATVDSLNALHRDAHAAGWPELAATPAALAPAFVRAQRDLALPWTAQRRPPEADALQFLFHARVDRRHDGPVFSRDARQRDAAAVRARGDGRARVEPPRGLRGRIGSEFRRMARLHARTRARAVQRMALVVRNGRRRAAAIRSRRTDRSGSTTGPRADLRAISDRIRRHAVPAASRAGYALYDRFLKANRVEAGVRSYGEVLRLLLGTRFNEDGAPVLRRAGVKGQRVRAEGRAA